ncbi:MAG: alpha/beta fold hydrolase, partial [Planctomycetota bacterium]
MRSERVQFQNRDGLTLAARLEEPDGADAPRGTAVFAHCFTCSKDIPAAARIARGLSDRGFSVLRFDFTGLGSSDGDFANTNFSSNVQDLEDAAAFMAERGHPPSLLVGHSLGGAAVLAAAPRIDGVEAVVTIG